VNTGLDWTTVTTDKLAGMAAIVKNLPYFGFGNLATLRLGLDDRRTRTTVCRLPARCVRDTAETKLWVSEATRRTKSIRLCISTPSVATAGRLVGGMTSFIPLEGASLDILRAAARPARRRASLRLLMKRANERTTISKASRPRPRDHRDHVTIDMSSNRNHGDRGRHFRCRTMTDARRPGDNQFPAMP